MDESRKRKDVGGNNDSSNKRTKIKKQWTVPQKGSGKGYGRTTVQPGDSGIWATCDRGKEGRCIGELKDLFSEYIEILYPNYPDGDTSEKTDGEDAPEQSIEQEIQAEIAGIKQPAGGALFTSIMLDVQCVVFFRTKPPIEPVSFVQRILEDAAKDPQRKRTRVTKRLSPMTVMGRASQEGLEKVAQQVLAPHFHGQDGVSKKFAIRPTIRNHNVLKRDKVIHDIAVAVGPGHKVDLKNYDLLILIEIYTNVCGMSVVDNRYEQLKRYNLAEIFDPTPKQITKDPMEEASHEVEDVAAAPGEVKDVAAAPGEVKDVAEGSEQAGKGEVTMDL